MKDGVLDNVAISDPGWQACEMSGRASSHISPGKYQIRGIYGRVVADGKSLFTNDPGNHPDSIGLPEGHPPLTAFLGVPLIHEGATVGMMAVANRDGGYGQDELEVLEALAPVVIEAFLRKRAEEALRASEQRLRMALDGGRLGLWEWDVESGQCIWNDRMHEIVGLDASEPVTHEKFLQHIHGRDVEAMKEQIQRSHTDGSDDLQAEFRLVGDDGRIRWVAVSGKVIRDASGRAIRRLGIMYDITERKRMEHNLRRLNSRLEEQVHVRTSELREAVGCLEDEVARRTLAEGQLREQGRMLDGFFRHTITPLAFMDRNFNFVQVNEAYAAADSKTPDYFVGKNHFDLYPHDRNKAIFERVVQTGQLYRAHAKAFSYPNDTSRISYWDWQLTPLLDDHGQVKYLVLNLQDVTQRQTALRELEQRACQLQKLTMELSQTEDRERKRMAEVLHDGLQQQLAAAKFHVGLLNNRAKDDAPMREIAGQLNQVLRDAIEQSRNLSHELSPPVLHQSDLSDTFEWLAGQIRAKHGMAVETDIYGQVDSQSESIKTFLYRAAKRFCSTRSSTPGSKKPGCDCDAKASSYGLPSRTGARGLIRRTWVRPPVLVC